jgi:hypothetical protein
VRDFVALFRGFGCFGALGGGFAAFSDGNVCASVRTLEEDFIEAEEEEDEPRPSRRGRDDVDEQDDDDDEEDEEGQFDFSVLFDSAGVVCTSCLFSTR